MLRKIMVVMLLISMLSVAAAITSAADEPVCAGSPPTRMVGVTTGQVARTFSTLRAGVPA